MSEVKTFNLKTNLENVLVDDDLLELNYFIEHKQQSLYTKIAEYNYGPITIQAGLWEIVFGLDLANGYQQIEYNLMIVNNDDKAIIKYSNYQTNNVESLDVLNNALYVQIIGTSSMIIQTTCPIQINWGYLPVMVLLRKLD